MNTTMTLQVRELSTDWDVLTIGRVTKVKRTFALKDLAGQTLFESSSLDKVAAFGRRYASEQGYTDAAYA